MPGLSASHMLVACKLLCSQACGACVCQQESVSGMSVCQSETASKVSVAGAVQGFHRVQDNLEDICLDNPRGVEQLQHISARGISEGWLDADWDTQSLSLRSVSSTQGAPHTIQVLYALPAHPPEILCCQLCCCNRSQNCLARTGNLGLLCWSTSKVQALHAGVY